MIHDKRGREQKKLFLLLTCKVHCATSSLECLLFSTCNSRLPYYRKLTPVSQMEVGCSSIWGLTPTTQTQVGGTPHKPALPATQPRAPLATPDPKSSSEFNGETIEEKPLPPRIGRGGRGKTRKHTNATTPNAEPSQSDEAMRRRTSNMRRSR